MLHSNSFAVAKENRRIPPCTAKLVPAGTSDSWSQISTSVEGNKGGVYGSSKFVSRVEDSLRESQEANQSSKQHFSVVAKNKLKQSQFQLDSKSNRIKDTYLPLGKQKKKGTQLNEDEADHKKSKSTIRSPLVCLQQWIGECFGWENQARAASGMNARI